MWRAKNSTILNGIICSDSYSGLGIVARALSALPATTCHEHLLHADEDVRRKQHEKYFGDSGKVVDWFDGREISAEQYLSNKIFDRPLRDEQTLCVTMLYEDIESVGIWEFLGQQSRHGDFCLIHVERNPLMSYAEKYGFNSRILTHMQLYPEQLETYIAQHESSKNKLNRYCRDRAIIPFRELILDYRRTCRRLSTYLGIKFDPYFPPKSTEGSEHLAQSLRVIEALQAGASYLQQLRTVRPYLVDLF